MTDIVDLAPESNGFDDMDADLEDYIGKLLWFYSFSHFISWGQFLHFASSALGSKDDLQ